MQHWHPVCLVSEIAPNVGVCALVADKQVALFNCTRTGTIYAIDNYDPFGKANVLSRGMIGDIDGEPHVASPLYKQHFSLQSGMCAEDNDVHVTVYPVQIIDGLVHVGAEVGEAPALAEVI